MYFDALVKQIEREFPNKRFVVKPHDFSISVPPKAKGFGAIEIQDDCDEFIIFIGNFTHVHFSCNDTSLSKQQQADSAASEVIDFLTDLFADKIVFWGSAEKGGGFYYPEFSSAENEEKNGFGQAHYPANKRNSFSLKIL
ncbi:hypothetical protein EXU30_02540 [Shewanella maritima]|uniref:Uncharacterized protein n=1 Tax=Shewanella maritima TaxID=2520507 RepID=A0A411PDV7_9GAMM|nr:hypothetical protein [Shewanella maritima]QBF81694.1 hypothetical protein EXU30_02540 [Shewanella maritima]